ncbi:MAG: tetratricopeptide repeat protein, partial [Streptosporangiaceae bacterium]
QYDEAQDRLRGFIQQAKDMKDPNPGVLLRLMHSQAVLYRQLEAASRRSSLVDPSSARMREVRLRFLGSQGPDHPETLAAELSLAIGDAQDGRWQQAEQSARACLERLSVVYSPGHPFVHVCRLDLGAFLLGSGQNEAALTEIEAALGALEAALGDCHPWTIAARLTLASCLDALGRRDECERLCEQAHDDSTETLGRSHPYTETATEALRILRSGGSVRNTIQLDLMVL